ncbi:MAG: hypothetical protein GXO25_06925 [Euryarchaeota archaeon]|nr:hypothetical protein [Euryarchaeota archaeon]
MSEKYGVKIKVLSVRPYTVHGERVIDQVVKCELKSGAVIYLFDSDMLIDNELSGSELFVAVEVLVFGIVEIQDKICGVKEIRKNCTGKICGRYIEMNGEYYLHTQDGTFTLSENNRKYVDKKVVVDGRFDVVDIL